MEDESMFKKLTVIVDRGMAEDVMDIARKAGVSGEAPSCTGGVLVRSLPLNCLACGNRAGEGIGSDVDTHERLESRR
jgi:hypothetical protein